MITTQAILVDKQFSPD